MRCRPFESAASELVDESLHPVEQLELLTEVAKDKEGLGDADAVIECRIKQLSLHRLLVYLYDFPLQPLVRAQAELAEAYASGGYFKQAYKHLTLAQETSSGGVYDEAQCRRLQVDILVAKGAVQISEGQLDAAHASLKEAARLGREVYGEMDVRSARIHTMLGTIARQRLQHADAIDHFSAAWEVYDYNDGPESEETIRLALRIAEVQHLDNKPEDALQKQTQVVEKLQKLEKFPALFVDASAQLARWLEACGQDQKALEALQAAERTVTDNRTHEDSRAVEVKRDVALLHLKLGDHDTALQYLNDVHYYERRLHGSLSVNVARTLKALGTVHLVKRNLVEAEDALLQALRIFESEHPPNNGIIRDIHAKLNGIRGSQ